MALQVIIFLGDIMEKLLLVLICILGVVIMVKGFVSRFQYRLKATHCSLQTSGKIIDIKQEELNLYRMTIQYYAEGKFIERKPSITYFQMKYFKNNKNVTQTMILHLVIHLLQKKTYFLYVLLIVSYSVALYQYAVLLYLLSEVNYEENNITASKCIFNSLYTIFNYK